MCLLKSPQANYKASTSKERKQHKDKECSFCYLGIIKKFNKRNRTQQYARRKKYIRVHTKYI
jgi:hypothetical protein